MTGFEDEQVAVAITPDKSQAATLTDKDRKGAKSSMSTASKETEHPLTRSAESEKPPAQQTGIAGAPRNHDSAPTSTWMNDDGMRFQMVRENNFVKRCWAVMSWTPPICRWDVENPPKFDLGLNILFSFVRRYSMLLLLLNWQCPSHSISSSRILYQTSRTTMLREEIKTTECTTRRLK